MDDLSTTGVQTITQTFGTYSDLTREAIEFLLDNGAVNEIVASRYIITDKGYDYLERRKSPWKYWLKTMAIRLTSNLAWLVISNVITAVITIVITAWVTTRIQGS